MQSTMSAGSEHSKSRRVEMILRQVESLPTLPAVATRLLALTASDDSHIKEIIDLISCDQALTLKVLSLCQRASRGIRTEALTIEKAVPLLGLNTIRGAVLAVKVFEVFDRPRTEKSNRGNTLETEGFGGETQAEEEAEAQTFDRVSFWRHCLAVGIACELICAAHPNQPDLQPSEAFVCGLLHDVGKLALDYMLPKSFARVIELTELNQGNIAELERRVIGIDHHTVGKRLAEQWKLPDLIRDCVWLHGWAFESLPDVPHRRLIGVVTLADLLARKHHVGYSGNFHIGQNPDQLAELLGLKPGAVNAATEQLHEELQRREEVLGLREAPSRELYLRSIQQANEMLGRLNGALERRARAAAAQTRILEAIQEFQGRLDPSDTVSQTLDAIVASAHQILGGGYYAVLYQPRGGLAETSVAWQLYQYEKFDDQPRLVNCQEIDPPSYSSGLADLHSSTDVATWGQPSMMAWLANHLRREVRPWDLQVMSLTYGGPGTDLEEGVAGGGGNRGGGAVAAVLLFSRSGSLPTGIQALASCWASAVAAAGQHEAVRRLGESLAASNMALTEAQERLVRNASMVRLGELAAGAAHEMNTPLAVISGRSQLLGAALPQSSKEHAAAMAIVEQSHRLSELISMLRFFADPPKPQKKPTDLAALLDETIKRIRHTMSQHEIQKPIFLHIKKQLPPIMLDPNQISLGISELLLNATQALPKTSIHVSVRMDSAKENLTIQVKDDGRGMDEYTLEHAMDPFFSFKTAGRQMGMGLTRAQQVFSAHGGRLELQSTHNAGTVATVVLPLDSGI